MQKPLKYFVLSSFLVGGMFVSTPLIHAKEPAAQEQATKAPQPVESKEKIFNAKTFKLENGMEIVVVENHRAPVVTHMVWYKVGRADEPTGKSGMAHFLEHLLFKGQKSKEFGDLAPGEFSKIIRSLGGQDNAFTSQDYTAFFQSIASDQLETVMKMEAGRMRGLDMNEKDFAAENKVILEERRQRTDNDPRAQLSEQLDSVLFPNHPYGTPVIGWADEIAALKWSDVQAFYLSHYAPNNALLIVSGDVKAQDVFDMAKNIYGKIQPIEIKPRSRIVSPPFTAKTLITLEHAVIKEPSFVRTYRVPSYRQNKDESLSLDIIQEIMGGGPSSRLYKSLVVEQKIATSVSMSYQSAVYDDGTLEISATPASGKTIEDVKAAIDEQLNLLIKDGVSDAELKDAVTRMQDSAVYARDSLSGPAMILGYNLVTGTPLEDIEHWPDLIAQIKKDRIQSVSDKYINPEKPTIHPPVEAYLLPPSQDHSATKESVK